eukprot:CAMPEP_0169062054 /NCGR_PEP_ID=MMETSP1015-20121227/469_1 /TAXON_ID=342587 /ORGANISM="Karlodinium micrum, Strain CCMP2283" /LENGTH=67 /DNA_ID=CAMNT_0009120143 /DNA_START=863 /DNA_END=1066 /DNA_ORIENTATION=-
MSSRTFRSRCAALIVANLAYRGLGWWAASVWLLSGDAASRQSVWKKASSLDRHRRSRVEAAVMAHGY